MDDYIILPKLRAKAEIKRKLQEFYNWRPSGLLSEGQKLQGEACLEWILGLREDKL